MRLSFDAIASQFDHQRGLPREALTAWIKTIDELAGGTILRIVEPGIGTGRITLPLAARGHHVTGTDISIPMMEQCNHAAQKLGISDQIEIINADAIDLPFAEHAFDLAVIAQLMYLVPDWPMVLDELARVVKPGGHVIYLSEPTTEGEVLAKWSSTWRALIERNGYRHTASSPTDADIHAEFLRRWPDVLIRDLSSWQFGQTVEEGMRDYAGRLRPLYRDVSGADFNRAVTDFLTWADRTFPEGTTRLEGTVTLTAMIALV